MNIKFVTKLLTLPGLGLGPGLPGFGPLLPGPGLGWKRGRHFPSSSPRLLMHLVCSGQSVLLLQGVGGMGLHTLSVQEVPLTQSLSLAQLGRHFPRLFSAFNRSVTSSNSMPSGSSGISISSGISGFGVQVVSAGQLGWLTLQGLGGGTLWQAPERHACPKRQSLVTSHPLRQILQVPFLISAQTSAFGQSASDSHRIGPKC